MNAVLALRDRRQFETFLRLVAGRVEQLMNYESLAAEVGVSAATVKAGLSVLEASYITFTLPSYTLSATTRAGHCRDIQLQTTNLL